MRFNMDRAMRNLGYLTMLTATVAMYSYIFVQMIGRLCR